MYAIRKLKTNKFMLLSINGEQRWVLTFKKPLGSKEMKVDIQKYFEVKMAITSDTKYDTIGSAEAITQYLQRNVER